MMAGLKQKSLNVSTQDKFFAYTSNCVFGNNRSVLIYMRIVTLADYADKNSSAIVYLGNFYCKREINGG